MDCEKDKMVACYGVSDISISNIDLYRNCCYLQPEEIKLFNKNSNMAINYCNKKAT